MLQVKRAGTGCDDYMLQFAIGGKVRAVWTFDLGKKRNIALRNYSHAPLMDVVYNIFADTTNEVKEGVDVRTVYFGVMFSLLIRAHIPDLHALSDSYAY